MFILGVVSSRVYLFLSFVSIRVYLLHIYSCLFVSILIGFVLSFRCIAHYEMCSFASSHAQILYVCRLTCSNTYLRLRVYSCLFVSILFVSISDSCLFVTIRVYSCLLVSSFYYLASSCLFMSIRVYSCLFNIYSCLFVSIRV